MYSGLCGRRSSGFEQVNNYLTKIINPYNLIDYRDFYFKHKHSNLTYYIILKVKFYNEQYGNISIKFL